MESPISRTRGRFVSFAWEIQMSHHSMASRAGGAGVSFSAAWLANPAASQSANPTVFAKNRQKRVTRIVITLSLLFITRLGIWLSRVRVLFTSRCALDELRGFIQ